MSYESLTLLLMSPSAGIFMQTMTMARSIGDCSNASLELAAPAKNAGVPAGLGFIVDPGGWNSEFKNAPYHLFCYILFCSIVLSYFNIPETAPVKRMTPMLHSEKKDRQQHEYHKHDHKTFVSSRVCLETVSCAKYRHVGIPYDAILVSRVCVSQNES